MGAAKRTFTTLDGMRGVAALAVVMRHTPQFFGSLIGPESFLAVDLFFVMSGFVLAHAYHERLDVGGFAPRFMALRLIRLYPLYILGLGLAVVAVVSEGRLSAGDIAYSAAIMATMVMEPTRILDGRLYQLNGPCWSLYFELIGSAVMAVCWKRLTNRVVVAICAASALMLILATLANGTADAGYIWMGARIGFARLGYSFFMGLLIYRLRDKVTVRLSPWLALMIAAVALFYAPPTAFRPAYELAWIFAGFPALVAVAVQREPVFGARVFSVLGAASYAIYVLHWPMRRFFEVAVQSLTHRPASAFAPWAGWAFVGLMVVISLVLDRVYDGPVRKWAVGWLLRRRDQRIGGEEREIGRAIR